MKPYFQDESCTIYHCDARFFTPIGDVIVTDPPYGIEGAVNSLVTGGSKGNYEGNHFADSPEYVRDVIVPTLSKMREMIPRMVLTPGQVNIHRYPEPSHCGCFYYPASTSVSRWGMRLWQPIFYYGKDPYQGHLRPDSKVCYDSDRVTQHPCPKPLKSWKWLVERSSLEGETVVDPFMGSGTTLRAAKDLGRKAIGIEIEERYCEMAAKRLSQQVFDFEPKKTVDTGAQGILL